MRSSARTGIAEGDTNVQFEAIQSSCTHLMPSTVLAGGTFPGPVITGFKGDRFLLNVVNALTDDTMTRTTSVVRPPHSHFMRVNLTKRKNSISTGTGYFRGSQIGPMVLPSSRNAPSPRIIHFCTNFVWKTKREPFGIIRTTVGQINVFITNITH